MVHLFGEKTRINGRKVKDYDYGKGESLETVVALEVELEKGMEYTVGLFFEHPYELEFDGVTEVVTAIPLKVPGLLAKHKVINVICFRVGKVMTGLGKYKKKTILEDWWGITQSDYAVETLKRLVFMSRLCFDAGYISEEEAWNYIDIACERLRFFDSWSSFTTRYLIGRTMWDVEHPFIQDFRKFEKELLQPGNLWNKTAL